ncbi:MAG: formate dehydrogenase accessory sulfurtransferase FdhD [Thermodesulfobacteriota bacterium]
MQRSRFLPIQRYWKQQAGFVQLEDELALEEPLEIFVQEEPYSSTMRLPGDDLSLVRGFCFTEGLIDSLQQIQEIKECTQSSAGERILVQLADTRAWLQGLEDKQMQKHQSLSSCGLCGRLDLESLLQRQARVPDLQWRISAANLLSLQHELESRMELFERTGCAHAAALFSPDLDLLGFAEDIGRHNALDKAIGQALFWKAEDVCPLGLVSSRLSLEMVLKAARLGLQVLAGVSAATTLAVKTAQELNMTLIGFLRPSRMNVYTHAHRLY